MSKLRWVSLCSLSLACASGSGIVTLPPAPPPKPPAELQAWRAPPPLPSLDAAPPSWVFQRAILKNGLAVTVLPRPETSLAAIGIWIPSAADRTHGGIATMADALRSGTIVKPGMTLINPRLAQAEIAISTTRMGTSFTWYVLPSATFAAVDLMAAFVQRPAFDEREVRVRLEQTRAAAYADSESWLTLTRLARRAIPGWGMPTEVDDARWLAELKVDTLRRLYQCGIRPEGAELVIAGPVSGEEAIAWVRRAFEAWSPAAVVGTSPCDQWRPNPERMEFRLLERPVVNLVEGSHDELRIVIVSPGPPSQAEYAAFRVVVAVLESRARRLSPQGSHGDERGRIDVSLNTDLPQRPLIELTTFVAPGRAHETARTLLAELRGLATTLTDAEVGAAKRRLKTSILSSFASNAGLANAVLWQRERGGSVEGVQGWIDGVMKVEVAACRQLAEQWLSGAQPSIAISGKLEELDDDAWPDADVRRMEWVRFVE